MSTRDPHLNAFYYYAGRRMADTDRDQQIEDNTTKALINTLQQSAHYGSPDDLLMPFLAWIGVERSGQVHARFALQRKTIGEGPLRRARQKVLLGIAPHLGSGDSAGPRPNDRESRPDAWIWGRDFVVAIETKIVGTFNECQLATHEQILGPAGVRRELKTWNEVFAFLASRLKALDAEGKRKASIAQLDQLVRYLRILAYQRRDFVMEDFDGFAPEVFDSFSAVEDEEAEDARRSALHLLETFVRDLQGAIPKGLRGFEHLTKGVIRARDRHVWATLSRLKRPVDEPHYSFSIGPEGFSIRLLLEGNKPTTAARQAIASDPDRFLGRLRDLPEYDLVLARRWQKQARLFRSAPACTIDLAAVGQEDVAYLLTKMAVLKRKEKERGFFEIHVRREFPRDMKVLRSRDFVRAVAGEMEKLAVLDRFLSGA